MFFAENILENIMQIKRIDDTAIAKHFKVNRGSIYQVRSGKTWKNY